MLIFELAGVRFHSQMKACKQLFFSRRESRKLVRIMDIRKFEVADVLSMNLSKQVLDSKKPPAIIQLLPSLRSS